MAVHLKLGCYINYEGSVKRSRHNRQVRSSVFWDLYVKYAHEWDVTHVELVWEDCFILEYEGTTLHQNICSYLQNCGVNIPEVTDLEHQRFEYPYVTRTTAMSEKLPHEHGVPVEDHYPPALRIFSCYKRHLSRPTHNESLRTYNKVLWVLLLPSGIATDCYGSCALFQYIQLRQWAYIMALSGITEGLWPIISRVISVRR